MAVALDTGSSIVGPRDLYCRECNYGIVPHRRRLPPRCPMCGASSWISPARRSWGH